MFESATLKLTTWYLAILIAISLIFSVIIYSITSNEIGARIGYIETRPGFDYGIAPLKFEDMLDRQVREAQASLIGSLLITNICIWVVGGFGSYYLAKRTLRPIEETHEAQSRFTSDASHELRTPLASMKTELEVALREPHMTQAEMHTLLRSSIEEVDKLTKLSQTLLQLSRLEHENIEKERVSLNDITASVSRRFNKLNKRIKIVSSDTLYVFANPSNVDELLTILLDNALKYSPVNSTVFLELIQQKNMTGFTVTNEGEGIPANILPRIFDRFYRADTSRTGGEKKGYGLGLSLAKKIVELHGGELTVTSIPQEKTIFRILLPTST